MGKRSAWTVLMAAAVLAAGCTSSPFEQCDRTRTRLRDDSAPAPALGFAPAEVLSWALTEHAAQAQWGTPQEAVRTSHADGTTELRYTLERGSGRAVQVVHETWCGPEPTIEIPVVARVVTSDGALDESLPGTLRASRVGFAQLSAKLPLEVEEGSLVITSEDPALHLTPRFSARLTPSGHAGGIAVMVERRTAEAVALLPGFNAMRWPVGSACGHEVIAAEIDNSDPEWSLPVATAGAATWSGTSTEDGALLSASLSLELGGVLCESADGQITAPVTLSVSFADPRPGLTLASVLVQTPDGLALLPPPAGPGGYWGGAPDRFIARHTDFGLDLSGYDTVELQVELSMSDGALQGRLALVGFAAACGSNTCGPRSPVLLLELRPEATP